MNCLFVTLISEYQQQQQQTDTQERIKELVAQHPVLLFMKGSKLFPQCGFSNTATQILNSFNIDFHTVDVLSDEKIRQGIKEYSNWPTIPQLYGTYVCVCVRVYAAPQFLPGRGIALTLQILFVCLPPKKKQVAGEFLGGSDIMIEMYQSGELGEMIEKAKADMV